MGRMGKTHNAAYKDGCIVKYNFAVIVSIIC